MKSTLDYRDGRVCVLNESEQGTHGLGSALILVREWWAVRKATEAEAATLVGRPLNRVESTEGLYVDEDGEAYQIQQKKGSKPLAVEHLAETEKTELEALLETSLIEGQANGEYNGAKHLQKKNRSNDRKRAPFRALNRKSDPSPAQPVASAPPSDSSLNSPRCSVQLNLHQKLAEVRRRIGYIQKRGHNERFGYNYVTAADIAGAVGDLLSELGVMVVPTLESITHEPVRTTNGQVERVAHVVMTYRFTDVDSGETVTVKVPGEGLDSGDKAPYKAMTGALKYALLQSFLLATGDDPEDERTIPSGSSRPAERAITAAEASRLRQLIDETGTELERVLAYYKVAALEEMKESTYLRAVEVLNRKLSKRGNPDNQEPVHAAD